jgi:hypothetical protein
MSSFVTPLSQKEEGTKASTSHMSPSIIHKQAQKLNKEKRKMKRDEMKKNLFKIQGLV